MQIEVTGVRTLKDGSQGYTVRIEGISIDGWRYRDGNIMPPGAMWKGRFYANVNPVTSDPDRYRELVNAIHSCFKSGEQPIVAKTSALEEYKRELAEERRKRGIV